MRWKTLYKKTTTGKIQQWTIRTQDNIIVTRYGQVGGKLQVTTDTIKVGLNKGKANATTAIEQAVAEARSKFIKQKKLGYVLSLEQAEAGEVDAVIKGGLLPMLAHKYKDHKSKVTFQCAVQPKLDGLRAISYINGGIWSRTRKEITKLPHIQKAIDSAFEMGIVHRFDGELYNHDLKDEFEQIVGAVTSKNQVSENAELIQYHIYDIPDESKTFEERTELLQDLFRYIPEDSPLKLVPTIICNSEEEIMQAYEDFMEQGYEGAMVRNLNSMYKPSRSFDLQKLKVMEDAEFKVTGIEEGNGKLAGHVGAFWCEVNDKDGVRKFKAKLKGDVGFLKKCFEDHSLWTNKMLTVSYQGYTRANKLPRFPVGVRFRDMNY